MGIKKYLQHPYVLCFIVGSMSRSFLEGCIVGFSSIAVLIALIAITKKYV